MKPKGEAHPLNTAAGKHERGYYDGHAREPGAAHDAKRARWRRKRRKEHQSINQMRADMEAQRSSRQPKAGYDAPDSEA